MTLALVDSGSIVFEEHNGKQRVVSYTLNDGHLVVVQRSRRPYLAV